MAPRLHFFVCANRRGDSPLGPGCADQGDAVYDAMKHDVSKRGLVTEVWVTKTHCLGICPKDGATVARYPGPLPIRTGVDAEGARAWLAESLEEADSADREAPIVDLLERDIGALEQLQREKVLALARRLEPGLTLEDVQNPHDFPALDDPDWHYADGVLSGIATALSALRARRQERALRASSEP